MAIRSIEDELRNLSKRPTCSDYSLLIRRCLNAKDGKLIHDHIIRHGFGKDGYMGNLLVQMYGKCGSLDEARAVFNAISYKNTFSWNFMLTAYAQNGHHAEALDLYKKMDVRGNGFIFATALAACSNLRALEEGKAIHKCIISHKQEDDVVVQNALVTMYARCGSVVKARKLFDRIGKKKNSVSWNAMISSYVQQQQPRQALDLYKQMQMEQFAEPNSFIFASVLTACSDLGDLKEGKAIHKQIHKSGLKLDIIVKNALMHMYARCGELDNASILFEKIEKKDIWAWTSLISSYAQQGHSAQAHDLYKRMKREGLRPNASTFRGILAACFTPEESQEIVAEIDQSIFKSDSTVRTSLISMYIKSKCLQDARRVFDEMEERDMVCWSSIILGYAQEKPKEAVRLYHRMIAEGIEPNALTFSGVIQACVCLRDLEQGRQIHARIVAEAKQDDILREVLVDLYCKCSCPDEARKVFEELEQKDVISWTAMIGLYVQQWQGAEALEIYDRMISSGVEPDIVTFVNVLGACAITASIEIGKDVHTTITKQGLQSNILDVSLLNMYVKCGDLKAANDLFEEIPEKGVAVWTIMIRSNAAIGQCREALRLFQTMILVGEAPNSVTMATVLPACTSIEQGKAVHRMIVAKGFDSYPMVQTSLVCMYAKNGTEGEVREVFDRMEDRCVVTWNALIAAYNRNGKHRESLDLYNSMDSDGLEPNDITFLVALGACSKLGALDEGRKIHARILSCSCGENLPEHVKNALVNMYVKCSCFDEAVKVFESMKSKNVICWTSIVSGYVQQGLNREALDAYKNMDTEPDEIIHAAALSACASLPSLEEGKRIHARIISKNEVPSDFMGTALISMYAKCGHLKLARKVFDEIARLDVVCWTAMMTAYSQHGDFTEVLDLYRVMCYEGVNPDPITFINVLISCSRVGLTKEGLHYMTSMRGDHGVEWSGDHYLCVVDLLCRGGRLAEAEELIDTTCTSDGVAWKTLLSACRDHGDSERGSRAAERASQLEPDASAPYVLLSSIYASSSPSGGREVVKELQHEEIYKYHEMAFGVDIDNESVS